MCHQKTKTPHCELSHMEKLTRNKSKTVGVISKSGTGVCV